MALNIRIYSWRRIDVEIFKSLHMAIVVYLACFGSVAVLLFSRTTK